MSQMKDGCVKPARGPIVHDGNGRSSAPAEPAREVPGMRARVGLEAPDFEANAFVGQGGFKPIRLSDFKGKWIVLCFYPGDFTFV
jgi:hypothetical protein